jgi:hypothetical protein
VLGTRHPPSAPHPVSVWCGVLLILLVVRVAEIAPVTVQRLSFSVTFRICCSIPLRSSHNLTSSGRRIAWSQTDRSLATISGNHTLCWQFTGAPPWRYGITAGDLSASHGFAASNAALYSKRTVAR